MMFRINVDLHQEKQIFNVTVYKYLLLQLFECSCLLAFYSCVYYTIMYKCGRIGTKWLFFFTLIEERCVVIEKNIDKKLANRISYQI